MHCIFHEYLSRKFTKSLPLFKYPALSCSQIRILELHPGQFESQLAITLHECDIGKATNVYEALSYVWGDPKRNIPIECNGAKLFITASLQIALRRIRFKTKTRFLWIDAICINQNDLEERGQQVPYMSVIFPSAKKVLIWLGEADKKVELALKTIDAWADFNHQYDDRNNSISFAKFEENFALKPGYKDSLEAVGELTYRPWFNRCWTFQEILLSTTAMIIVGKFDLTWDRFYLALKAFPIHLLADDVLNFNALFMCYGKAKVGSQGLIGLDAFPVSRALSRLLIITRNFIASDPRDKIYSLISVAEVKHPCNFFPDYGLSVRDTFISLTLAMIRDESSLDVLMSNGELERDKKLPSWCPDWRCKRGVVLTGYYDSIMYNVNAGLQFDFTNLQMHKKCELELEGALIDVVTEVYDLADFGEEFKASFKNINFTAVLSKFSRKIGLSRIKLEEYMTPEATLLRTLSADHWFFSAHLNSSFKELWFPIHLRFHDLKQDKTRKAHQLLNLGETVSHKVNSIHYDNTPLNLKDFKFQNNSQDTRSIRDNNVVNVDMELNTPYVHDVIDKVYQQSSPFYIEGQGFENAEFVDELTLGAIAREAVSQAHFYFKGKKLLVTKRGYLALGTGGTKVGDNLSCFWGSNVPFVIRERERAFHKPETSHRIGTGKTTENSYEIIGECYVDGIMYGELFHSIKQGHKIQPLVDWIRFQKFRVC